VSPEPELHALLRQLEQRLLQPETRCSPEALGRLLADQFLEFGSSGAIYDRAAIVRALRDEPPTERSLYDFTARLLSPDVALVTYRSIRRVPPNGDVTHSLRSSIWKRIDGEWQMVFHQGTRLPQP
jgi:hypothetical protein